MSWTAVVDFVKKTAPLLGTVIAGAPGGAIATALSSLLGTTPGDNESLLKALTENPEAVTKLLQMQADHQLELQKIAVQLDLAKSQNEAEVAKAAISDVEDARKTELEKEKLFGSDKMLNFIAALIVASFFSMMTILIFYVIKTENKEFFYMLAGQLAGAFTTVVTYYFGSAYKVKS